MLNRDPHGRASENLVKYISNIFSHLSDKNWFFLIEIIEICTNQFKNGTIFASKGKVIVI